MMTATTEQPTPPASATIDREPRCWKCGRRLAEYIARPWSMRCQKCKTPNASAPPSSQAGSAVLG